MKKTQLQKFHATVPLIRLKHMHAPGVHMNYIRANPTHGALLLGVFLYIPLFQTFAQTKVTQLISAH